MGFADRIKYFDRPAFHILLIALLGLAAYSNTSNVPFQFDDQQNIVENPLIKDLKHFIEVPKEKSWINDSFRSRYMGFLSFALNYEIGGLDVGGYHVVNIAIHILNAMLVYYLVVLTFRTPYLEESSSKKKSKYIALFTALLFVSHPVQTQAVTYIVQRFASLAAFFFLLSFVLYIKWRLSFFRHSALDAESSPLSLDSRLRGNDNLKRLFFYFASLLSAVLAMKTKEMAATLPFVILLYELLFFKGGLTRRLLTLTPIILTLAVVPLTFIRIDRPMGEIMGDVSEVSKVQTAMPRLDYLFTQFRVVVTYLRLLACPTNQNLDYDYPLYNSFLNPEVFLSFLLLSSIMGLGVYFLIRSKKSGELLRLVSFGIAFFFIALFPESGIIPIVDVIFEHRLYLPSVGAVAAMAAGAVILIGKIKSVSVQRATVLLAALIPLVLAGAAYERNKVWANGMSLWQDVVIKSPRKARGHINLGDAYYTAANPDEAIKHYLSALPLDPSNKEIIHNNIGNAYVRKGLSEKAIQHYQLAVSINPQLYGGILQPREHLRRLGVDGESRPKL